MQKASFTPAKETHFRRTFHTLRSGFFFKSVQFFPKCLKDSGGYVRSLLIVHNITYTHDKLCDAHTNQLISFQRLLGQFSRGACLSLQRHYGTGESPCCSRLQADGFRRARGHLQGA